MTLNLKREQLRSLLTFSTFAALGHIVVVILTFIAVTWDHEINLMTTQVAFLCLALSAVRIFRGVRTKNKIQSIDVDREKTIFDVLIFSVSTAWTLFFFRIWQMPELTFTNLSTVQFIICGLLGAASFSLGCSRRSYYLFIFPILTGVAVHGFQTAQSRSDLIVQELVYLFFTLFVMKVQREQEKLWLENYHQKAELELILQSLPFGISVIDHGEYTYINDHTINQAGLTEAEFKGQKVGFQKTDPHYSDLVHHFIDSNEQRYVGEIKLFEHKSQTQKTYMIVLQKLVSAKRMICLTIDIDERKKVEAELATQNAKIMASSKMASLGEMASGLAHEINNPLAIISGISQSMERTLKAEKIESLKLSESIAKITKTANRIAVIIRGLRTFARDAHSDQMVDANVANLVQDTLAFCRTKFDNLGVDLQVTTFNKSLTIPCRETEISQVLLNLLNNALDAVEKLPEKWVRVEVSLKDQFVEIAVLDSGHGISPQIRDKIMEPFFTTKEVGRGTGLGLSISVGIAKAHHGVLDIDTHSPNTRFYLRLPKHQIQENSNRAS